MTELRQRKKESRKKRIVAASLRLFQELGFHKTTMEKIAVEAELAVGTLYNYFPSKTVLFFSVIEADTGNYYQQLDEVINNSKCLKSSVIEFFCIYLGCFSIYNKRVWAEVFGEMFLSEPETAKMIDIIDKQFINKLKELLFAYKKRRMLAENIDTETAAAVLYALLGYNIIRYVTESDMNENELRILLQSQAELVVGALVKT